MHLLIIEDSAVYRKILTDVLSGLPDVNRVTTASNGKIGLDKIDQHKPDVITLDVEMPGLSGLDVLRRIKAKKIDCPVIMVSAHTTDGAEAAIQALELGALDIVGKPDCANPAEAKASLTYQLKKIIAGIYIRKIIHTPGMAKKEAKAQKKRPPIENPEKLAEDISERMKKIQVSLPPEVCAIGASTGGPAALTTLLSRIPSLFPLPILVTLHMPPVFTTQLAKSINSKCKLTMVEASDGMPIKPKMVYLAPGGKQMGVSKDPGSGSKIIQITDDPPENNCKPSVDYLFRSVAEIYKGKSIGVILTGMGNDGAKGLRFMKDQGSKVIAQNKETCTVFGMPLEAINAGVVDIVSPLNEIVNHLEKAVNLRAYSG